MSLTIYSSKALEKIIKGCIKHDSRAQKALYERFSPAMFAVCLRYVRDTAESEDVLLRSFMKVFENISEGTSKSQLSRAKQLLRIMIEQQENALNERMDL